MSKKLIAVATAAALALSALVAAPAQASTFAVSIDGGSDATSHTSATVPGSLTIADSMESGTLDYLSTTSSTRTVMRFVITTAGAATLTVSTTGGVKVTEEIEDSNEDALEIGAGSATLLKSTTASLNTYTFYAYTNSTTAGSVVIDSVTTKKTYFIKAPAGGAQNLESVVFPTSYLSTQTDGAAANPNIITFQITDAFGNKLVGTNSPVTALTATGALVSATATYNTTKKRWEAWVHGTTQSNVAVQIALTAEDLTPAFPAAKKVAFSSASAGTLADQVTALTAQLVALQAAFVALEIIKDRKVSKLKYNRLARKWNAAFPSNKVWVKP